MINYSELFLQQKCHFKIKSIERKDAYYIFTFEWESIEYKIEYYRTGKIDHDLLNTVANDIKEYIDRTIMLDKILEAIFNDNRTRT